MKTVALILAAAATAAVAMCPNQCSGHGACTADDQCRCWKGYAGFDCSKRSCPVVESWAVDDAENPHAYQECAGKGICDTTTGACECFAGYEGRGCERSACANACSGHGKCRMLADLDTYAAGRTKAGSWSLAWDEKAVLTCECDGGYMGADCSQRICPHGDDPMTVCEQGNTEQVQQVVFKLPGDFKTAAGTNGFQGAGLSGGFTQEAGAMAMRFKSYANEVFYTAAVADPFDKAGSAAATISTNLEVALEGVPNFRVRNVDVDDAVVDKTTTTTEMTSTFKVTFRHEGMNDNSYGEQNLLQCPHVHKVAGGVDTFGCNSQGCSPMIAQPRATLVAIQAAADLTATTALTVGDATKAKFTADSVLTCPIGKTCTTATATTHQGAIAIYLEAIGTTGNDWSIYAQGYGNTAVGVAPTVGTIDTFTYIGRFSDYVSGAVGAASVATIDLSAIMPNTRYALTNNAAGAWAASGKQLLFHWFTTAECQSVKDITATTESFNNLDVENIECSGRGECDRASGVCACFDGYTGLACGEQTILI